MNTLKIYTRMIGRTVADINGCWLWQGAISDGYGLIGRGKSGKVISVHRLSYIYHNGEIPKGLQIDHLCRVRHCVNPKHLEAVTHRTNTLRGVGASAQNVKKTHCPQGHPLSGENLTEYGISQGKRLCRTCKNNRNR